MRTYAVLGNGASDDTQAIQHALDTTGDVYLPAGTYILSKTLKMPRSATLTGAGKNSVLKWRSTDFGIMINRTSGVSVGNLSLTGVVNKLIDITDSSDVHINHVWFSGAGTRTAEAKSSAAAVSVAQSRGVWIENSDFTDDRGFDIVANYSSNGPTAQLNITKNHIHDSHANISIGLFNTINSAVEDNNINQNNQTAGANNDGYGILVYCKIGAPKPPLGNRIVGNLVENTAGSAIYIQGASDTVIEHNRILDSVRQQDGKTLPAAAIAVNAGYSVAPVALRISILYNEIDGSGKAGIELSSTKRAIVRGNNVRHTAGRPIRLRFKNDQAVVKENSTR